MTWYKALDFTKNPLDIRPNPSLVGLEKEEAQLVSHIKKGEICFINGLTGSGKTSLLQRVQKKLKDHSFIYLDANELPAHFNLEEELKSKRSFLDKIILRKYPSEKQVLILDEFQAADSNLILNAKAKWELPQKGAIKSIVIAQIGKQLRNCVDSFKERIGDRKIRLPELDEKGLKKLLVRRLANRKQKRNYTKNISKDALSVLVNTSGRNPRRFLEYTDLLFDYHYKKFKRKNPIMRDPSYRITGDLAEEVLKKHNVLVAKGRRKSRKKKTSREFSEAFSDFERKILLYLKDHARTQKQVAKKLKVSDSYSRRCINVLKKQNLVVSVGNKGRQKLWQITPEARRIMVEV